MTDDIVYRLRVPLPYNLLGWTTTDLMNERQEAADEIQRLRAENDKASALIAKLAELLVPFSMLMNKQEQEMLIRAVRGEF